MTHGSKIRHFFNCLIIIVLLNSCEKNKNDVIPDVYVDFTIDLYDYPSLQVLSGAVTVDANDLRIPDRQYAGGFDGNGIIIYCGADGYYAYDRTCPHDYVTSGLSKKVNIDFIEAICPVCGTHYELAAFGTPAASGPGRYPLKNYKTNFDGRYIRVWNH